METQIGSVQRSLTPGPQKENLVSKSTVLYLQHLCSMTGSNFSEIDFSRYYEVEDRTQINRIFFAVLDSKGPKPMINVSSNEREDLMAFFQSAGPVKRLTDQKDRIEKELEETMKKYTKSLSDLIEKDRAIGYWQSRDNLPVIQDVQALLTDGSVRLVSINKDAQRIKFEMVNDVILRESNRKAGLDLVVNMGRYTIGVDFARNTVNVSGLENNIMVDGIIHPHVHSGICWGNAESTIREAFAIFDLKKIIETTLLVLGEYNGDSPYVSLSSFAQKRNIRERHGADLKSITHTYVWEEWVKRAGLKIQIFDRSTSRVRPSSMVENISIVKVEIFALPGRILVKDLEGEIYNIPSRAIYDEDNLPQGYSFDEPVRAGIYSRLLDTANNLGQSYDEDLSKDEDGDEEIGGDF